MPNISGGGGGAVSSVTVTLTNAQLRALPTTPVGIVPATETLNYATAPATLPVPVNGLLGIHQAVAYTNLDPSLVFRLAWGSDESIDVCATTAQALNAEATSPFSAGVAVAYQAFSGPNFGVIGSNAEQSFLDNALVLVARNGALGNLAGGGAANFARITVGYIREPL